MTGAAQARNVVILPLADVDHGNINRMSRAMAEGFAVAGLETTFMDYRDGAPPPAQGLGEQVESGRVLAVMAMNAVGFPTTGHDILVQHGTRLFVYGMDHPCHLFPLLEILPAGTMVSFPTASNVDCVHRWGLGHLRFLHVAHAAQPADPLPWTERDIPMLLVGNLSRAAADFAEVWQTRGEETPVLEAMAEIHAAGGLHTLEAVCRRALTETGNAEGPLAEPRAFAKILRYFDPYARALARESILKALAGLPVTVVGDWSGMKGAPPPAVTFTGPLEAETVRDMARRSKCVIDTMPPHIRSHERVFDAMANAATAATLGATDYPELDAGGAIVAAPDPAALADALRSLAADDGAMRQRAEAGHAALKDGHTWTNRAWVIKNALLALAG